jgi:hypothetical protein
MVVEFVAWDTSANTGKTGDAANITMRWVKDGTSSALTTTTVTEIDSVNAPGLYKVSLSATETDCLFGTLAGKSATANVSIMPVRVAFDYLPAVAVGATGGFATQVVRGGTAQAGSSSSITLDASAPSTNDIFAGDFVYIASGTGAGQIRQVISYNGTSKVATTYVAGPPVQGAQWVVTPDATSVFQMLPFALVPAAITVNSGAVAVDGTSALTESYANLHSVPTLAQLLFELRALLVENSVSGTTVTTKKIDGTTTAHTYTINSSTSPTSITTAS